MDGVQTAVLNQNEPDVFVALDVYFVELSVGGFSRDVCLHLHGHVAGENL